MCAVQRRGRLTVKETETTLIEAAVLVPVYRDDNGEIRVVLVRRGEGGTHGGLLAFPGGKHDSGDRSLLETALREAREEIGITGERIEILADLPGVETMTTGFLIFPFLARIAPPTQWQRDEREIAEIIEVKLSELAHPEAHGEDVRQLPGWPEPRRTPFYRVGPYQLWGATYRILHPLLPRLLAEEWTI
jgi:8-oxo-dGTP pyrophosphatase MutT (NUDIX family)